MPIAIPRTPINDPLLTTTPLANMAKVAELRAVCQELTPMTKELGLKRLSKEGRAQLGVTGGLFQLKKSLACLRLLRKRPDLAERLKTAQPAAWERLVDLRLALSQAKSGLLPTMRATDTAEVLLLAEITQGCDRIEDHLLAFLSRPAATESERLRLVAKFDDPARIRLGFNEFLELRRTRRAKRRAMTAKELIARRGELLQTKAKEQLLRSEMPTRGGAK